MEWLLGLGALALLAAAAAGNKPAAPPPPPTPPQRSDRRTGFAGTSFPTGVPNGDIVANGTLYRPVGPAPVVRDTPRF